MPPRQPSTRTPLQHLAPGRARPTRRLRTRTRAAPRTTSRRRGVCAGEVLTQSDPPLWNRASMPSAATTRPISSTVSNIAAGARALPRARGSSPAPAGAWRRRASTQPPLRPEAPKPAISFSRTAIRRLRVGLRQVVRRPQSRVAGADDGDVDVGRPLQSRPRREVAGAVVEPEAVRAILASQRPPSTPARRERAPLRVRLHDPRPAAAARARPAVPSASRAASLHRGTARRRPRLPRSRARRGRAGRTRRCARLPGSTARRRSAPRGPTACQCVVEPPAAGDVDALPRLAAHAEDLDVDHELRVAQDGRTGRDSPARP